MTVRKEMDGKRRKRGDGWQGKSGWKSFLPKLLLLMDGRSGTVVSVLGRTCRQGRKVEGARQSFHVYCTVNYKEAVSTKAGRSSSDLSPSGECEDKVLADQSPLGRRDRTTGVA